VVNADDPAGESILSGCAASVVRYGLAEGADLRGIDTRAEARNTRCALTWRGEIVPLVLPHPGMHNLMNALAAAGIALIRGVPLAEVARRLESAPLLAGRSDFFARADGVHAVVDFAHTPEALRSALEALRPRAGQLLVVFGCPGESDRGKRSIMGEIAGRLADLAILTADNPKHEDPEDILDEIEDGARTAGGRWERVADRADAIERAVREAQPGDVVLIAGKGHESYQIVGDAFVPYSDWATLEGLGFARTRCPEA